VAAAFIPLAHNFYGLMIVAALGGLANGFSSGTMMTVGADLAPEDARGEFLGVWHLLNDAGAASIPLIVGVVADVLTLAISAWVIAGVGLGAALIFAWCVPETLARSRPPQPVPGD
jgi:MFS family permease